MIGRSEVFEYRSYYKQVIDLDIGTVVKELLPGRITDESGSTIFVDCPHHTSVSHRSLHVWTDKQGWYCHGCGVGGDVLQLVEFIQSGQVTKDQFGKMPESHRNARDWLADKLGLPHLGQLGLNLEEIKKLEQVRALTLRAWECLTETAKFYHQKLLANDKALNWLIEKYAFDKKVTEDFLIGYADNTGLVKHLTDAGFTLRELTASGAFRPDAQIDEIVHPIFEGRIIFPYLSKGRVVFLIARKTPWTPDNQYEAGKYKKLPVHDAKQRPWVAEGIDNGSLFNEDILTSRPNYVIITEGITDCISLICRGFPAISPVTVNIRGNDWERIIPKLRGVKQVILCQDNEISEAGWKGALRSAARLAKEQITCRVAQLPLGREQESARQQLQQHNIHPGIDPKELKAIQELKSLKEWKEIEGWLEAAKIDVCSYFVSGKSAADFQTVIDSALLPVEFAIQSIPEEIKDTERTGLLNDVLSEIGHQPKLEQERLLKVLQKKTGEGLTTLRAGMKEAVEKANFQQRENIRNQVERNLGTPVFQRGIRSFYLVDNAIVEQYVRDSPDGPLVSSQEIANFHIRITEEEINDDGEIHEDSPAAMHKILSGEIISKEWKKPFRIEAQEWGSNARLAARISEQAGAQAMFSTQDTDTVRLVSSVVSGIPKQRVVYPIFGVHPKAGFVSPSLSINQGKIIPTPETGAIVNVGGDYAKAQRLDLVSATENEIKEIIRHLLTDYLDLQPRELTLPILAHTFLGPLLFGLNLVGEFPPYILFLVGSSGQGKTETAKLAQSIWGDFQVKEHLASWGSTPEINRQEAARCRGVLWVIDDFKRQKIGQAQWGNAIRVLLDYADLQARKRATPGSKVITAYPMKCMLLVTGEDIPAAETALLARSLIVNFEGQTPSASCAGFPFRKTTLISRF
ncbi:MAG: DUF927 domain-containing protein [Candidatus Schekmanbacteria bacterium]|nr:DUF927 domain-containing protein [Candidatus Schekmanbacteria bacterium]